MKPSKLLIHIPTFFAAKTVRKAMLDLNKLDLDYDVLVIDNHSEDDTLDVVKNTLKENKLKNYHVIKNPRNIGYGGSQKIALSYGIKHNYDKLIIFHSDNQYPYDYIPNLISYNIKTKAAMTIGTRLKHKNIKKVMPKWRYYGNYLLSALNRWAYNLNLDEFNSEFRIYDLKFIKTINIWKLGNHESYTIDSIVDILKRKAIINQIVIPCYYPPDAHHPRMSGLIIYLFYNIYRAFRFKLLGR